MDRLHEAQTIFQDTGGTHAVALASPDGKVFIHAEDVGRHNAMDKVIGRAVLTRQDLTGLVALLSGRISFEMALKCIRAGIPILAAVSAPTSMALELARELNLTTVGFVRDQRLNIYTAPERVAEVWEPDTELRLKRLFLCSRRLYRENPNPPKSPFNKGGL